MARKVSAGSVGEPAVGGVQANSQAVLTTAENLDITIDPAGTGRFVIAGDAQLTSQSDLRFGDSDNSHYVGFQAPATVTSNLVWTLPAADGTTGQSLTTNGSGTLSFATTGASITDTNSDSNVHYVPVTTQTTGSLTATKITTTTRTFSFQPSTGLLTVPQIQASGKVNSTRPENVQTGSYTFQLTDAGGVVVMNNSSTATLTVAPDSTVNFPDGTILYAYRAGSANATLAAGGGVTLTATGVMSQYEELYLRKRASNSWVVFHIASAGTLTVTGGSVSTGGGYKTHQFTSTGGQSLVAS